MFDIELVSNKNKSKTLIVDITTTVAFIKKKYGFEDNIELIYKGQILEDSTCLNDYDIVDDAQLFVIFLNTYNGPTNGSDSSSGNELITSLISILNAYNNENASSAANNRNYESELNQLEAMGFGDREQNRRLLILYRGNMEETISALIG